MACFNVGTKLRVRPDLREGHRYYMGDSDSYDVAVSDMVMMAGDVVTISEIIGDGRGYAINEDKECWAWTDEMFEIIDKTAPKKKDKMSIK